MLRDAPTSSPAMDGEGEHAPKERFFAKTWGYSSSAACVICCPHPGNPSSDVFNADDLTPRARGEECASHLIGSLRMQKRRLNPASSRNQGQVNTCKVLTGRRSRPKS